MEYPTDKYARDGQEITGWWIRSDSLEGFSPITQVYGICFDEKGGILICRQSQERKWQIPGGHPESDESPEVTLVRELEEETDVKVNNAKVLGVQKVNYPNNPDKYEGEVFYQARLICELDELLPQTPDPDNGNVWERIFVPADKITEYVKWGEGGAAMFKDAVELWKK